jgi:hypothetical protein
MTVAKLYFECHITLLPKHEEVATPISAKHKFKTSKIAGDEVLGDDVFFYCTSHSKYYEDLKNRMDSLTRELNDAGVPHLRRKIEHVVFDERAQ